jgi:2-methylcitrate dehydratase
VSPAQLTPDRIVRPDVQDLLRRISIHANDAYSARFPTSMPCDISITLRDGRQYRTVVTGYAGLGAPALSWEAVREKFEELSAGQATVGLRGDIADAVQHLDDVQVSDLTALLAKVGANHPSAEPAPSSF